MGAILGAGCHPASPPHQGCFFPQARGDQLLGPFPPQGEHGSLLTKGSACHGSLDAFLYLVRAVICVALTRWGQVSS